MYHYLSIEQTLLVIVFSFSVACLALTFQYYQTEGMIFEWYRAFWLHKIRHDRILEKYKRQTKTSRLLVYVSKPLGMCPYCNGAWIAIIFGAIQFKDIFSILLVVGVSWLFIQVGVILQIHKL